MHLVPPSVGESGEAQIGGWWATRVGALIAVIGVVFFGVYVSAYTTPLVRWLELLTIAVGVTIAGGWLERKALRVGPVITGAGHALFFFSAFAAYAVDPVKVVASPIVAALLQAGAVAYIGWAGWRRNSPTTVTMGVLLGYVSAFFAVFEDFHNMAAVACLLLATIAVVLAQKRDWRIPVYLSVVLTPVLTMARIIAERNDLGPFQLYGLVLAGMAIHFSLAYFPITREGELPKRLRRFQTVNISLSLLAGLVATGFGMDHVSVAGYFAGAGMLLLALTFWVGQKLPGDRFVSTLGVKAASLFALAAMAHFDARTRWIALLVETVVLVVAAHRSGRNALRFTALGVWLVSLGFFAEDAIELYLDIISADGLAALIYVVASVVTFDFLARQWRSTQPSSSTAEWLLGALAALPLWMLCADGFNESWITVGSTAFAFGLGGFAMWRRTRVAIPAGLVAFVTAQLAIQFFNESRLDTIWLWAGSIPIGLGALAVGAWMTKRKVLSESFTPTQTTLLGTVFVVLGAAALTGAFLQILSIQKALAATALMAIAITTGGLRMRGTAMVLGGMMSLATGVVLLLVHDPLAINHIGGGPGIRIMAIAVPVILILGSRHENQERLRHGHALVALVGVPLSMVAVGNVSALVSTLSITAIGAVFSVIAHRCRVPIAYAAASALGLLELIARCETPWIRAEGSTVALLGVTVLVLAVAIQPLWALRSGLALPKGLQRTWTIAHVIAAAWAFSVIALEGRAPWQDYGSVLWAIGGMLFFAMGVWMRARSHRIAGLVLLVLCIPRVFVHDIEEAKHRIAAFIVLGLLLLWVGFSYQKFRGFIDGTPSKKSDPE